MNKTALDVLRQSGRTTRMLRHVVNELRKDPSIYVTIIAEPSDRIFIYEKLHELLENDSPLRKQITVSGLSRESDLSSIQPNDQGPLQCYIDHAVYEHRLNNTLTEQHRWDPILTRASNVASEADDAGADAASQTSTPLEDPQPKKDLLRDYVYESNINISFRSVVDSDDPSQVTNFGFLEDGELTENAKAFSISHDVLVKELERTGFRLFARALKRANVVEIGEGLIIIKVKKALDGFWLGYRLYDDVGYRYLYDKNDELFEGTGMDDAAVNLIWTAYQNHSGRFVAR